MKLEIDHFFFTVSSEQFGEIVENKEIYKYFRDVSTETSEASYRGLYLTFTDGKYLEILYPHDDFLDGTFGLSLADLNGNKLDHSLFPASEYIKKKEVYNNDEYWYSLFDSPISKDERIYVFGMQYSEDDLEKRLGFKQQEQTFQLLEIKVISTISKDRVRAELAKFSKDIDLGKINFVEGADETVNLSFKNNEEIFNLTFSLK